MQYGRPPPPTPSRKGRGRSLCSLFPFTPFIPSPITAVPPQSRISCHLRRVHRHRTDLPVSAALGPVAIAATDGRTLRLPASADATASDACRLSRRAHQFASGALSAELGQAGLRHRALRARTRCAECLCAVAPALPAASAEIAGHAWHAVGATDLATGHRAAAVSLVRGAWSDQLACRGGSWSMSRSVRRSPPGC